MSISSLLSRVSQRRHRPMSPGRSRWLRWSNPGHWPPRRTMPRQTKAKTSGSAPRHHRRPSVTAWRNSSPAAERSTGRAVTGGPGRTRRPERPRPRPPRLLHHAIQHPDQQERPARARRNRRLNRAFGHEKRVGRNPARHPASRRHRPIRRLPHSPPPRPAPPPPTPPPPPPAPPRSPPPPAPHRSSPACARSRPGGTTAGARRA